MHSGWTSRKIATGSVRAFRDISRVTGLSGNMARLPVRRSERVARSVSTVVSERLRHADGDQGDSENAVSERRERCGERDDEVALENT